MAPSPEDDEFTIDWSVDSPGTSGDPGTRAWRQHTALGWVLAGLCLVLAGAALVPPAASGAQAWGAVGSLAAPPREAWSYAVPSTSVDPRLFLFRDVLVVATPMGIQGVAPRGGEELWHLAAVRPVCSTDGVVLTCVALGREGAVIVAISPATGYARTWTHPGALSAVALQDGHAVLERTVDRYAVVHLHADGSVAWRRELGPGPADWRPTAGMAVAGSRLLVEAPQGAVLDAATGRPELLDAHVDAAAGAWRARAGGTTLVYPLDGSPRFRLEAGGSGLVVDDEPGADLEVVPVGDGVSGVSRATGATLWSHRGVDWVAARQSDRILVVGEHGLEALEAATGATAWAVAYDGTTWSCPCFGDGTTVLLTARFRSTAGAERLDWNERTRLIGFDVASGERTWEVVVPNAIYPGSAVTDGEWLYAAAAGAVMAWRLT